MQFRKEQKGECTILEIEGKIVGAPDVATINQAFTDMLDNGTLKIIVNLEKLEMISSSGLGSLIANMTTLKKKNGSLKFANVSDKILHVLKITHLDKVFEIYDTVDDALISFSD